MVTLACTSLGSEVRCCRLALGLTLDELAERSGLSPYYLLDAREQTCGDPHVSTLMAVANALRVRADELLDAGQSASATPEIGALYERAPAEVREAITSS
jgi:transcriptional regulator with XRE-family HTH domain